MLGSSSFILTSIFQRGKALEFERVKHTLEKKGNRNLIFIKPFLWKILETLTQNKIISQTKNLLK